MHTPTGARRLGDGYPDHDRLALDVYLRTLEREAQDRDGEIDRLLAYFDRVVDMTSVKKVLVLGCGPRPTTVKTLLQKGFDVVGVEPVASFVASAEEYVGRPGVVLQGAAESIPLPDRSQDLVFFENVLEHVDSPSRSLAEIFRVVAPGGLVFILTTNRQRVSLLGKNGEYNVPFFHWFPRGLKEAFAFHQLHYDPSLANFTTRPAVHWYTYAELCEIGRQVGFGHFYSILDVLDVNDPGVRSRPWRRFLLNRLKYSPWLRALALTQVGGYIMMRRRVED